MAETMIGRRGQSNPVDAMIKVARESERTPYWKVVGAIGISGALLILSFYSVVAGWILEYTMRSLSGFTGITKESAVTGFSDLLATPWRLIAWHTVFMILTTAVVARGINSGIEQANKIMMPALFIILLGLIGYGIMAGDMAAAFRFMFHFDFSAVKSEVVLSAMGHSFFTLSLGMGSIMAYGSYLAPNTSIARSSIYIAFADTLVALLAGLAIFSMVFSQGLEPAGGPGLILQTLPLAFSSMPMGTIIGPLFFILVIFAAWTSSISLLEPATSLLIEHYSWRRSYAACILSFFTWLLGISVSFSFSNWSAFKIFGLNIFDFLDTITTKIMMPLSGLLIASFVGWVMHKQFVQDEIALSGWKFHFWHNTLRYVSPLAIALIFLHVLEIIG